MIANLLEYNYTDLVKKQSSISRLFPTFKDRTNKVRDNGGIRLSEIKPDLWRFRISSGTTKGKWYDAYLNFENIDQLINRHAKNPIVWTKDQKKINLHELALRIFDDTDLQLFCNCDAFLYWGPAYILTQRGAKYTNPENRPPNVRNPKQYGAYCKHLDVLIDQLPFYSGTMANFLRRFHYSAIQKIETQKRRS